jgi:hypothetical protein
MSLRPRQKKQHAFIYIMQNFNLNAHLKQYERYFSEIPLKIAEM